MASKRSAAFRENIHRLFDEAQATDLAPGIVSLIESGGHARADPRDPRLARSCPTPRSRGSPTTRSRSPSWPTSIREHGVLQPILVRPAGIQVRADRRRATLARVRHGGARDDPGHRRRVRRRRPRSRSAIIENLQREDVSPLEEAAMFRKMTDAFGYSVRQLAQKVGKDKGYVENRLRLTDAPADVRELVSVRKDTISHAYELMKIGDERKRRRLAKRIVAGELSPWPSCGSSPAPPARPEEEGGGGGGRERPCRAQAEAAGEDGGRTGRRARAADDALMGARAKIDRGDRRPGRHPPPARDHGADSRGQPGRTSRST